MKIKRLQTLEEIETMLQAGDFPVMFFIQAQILFSFFGEPDFEAYTLEHNAKHYFFFRKTRTGEIRILFTVLPDEAVEYIKSELKPLYIAYNQLAVNPEHEHQFDNTEVVVNIADLVQLKDKKIRKHYHQAVKKNTTLTFVPFKNIPIADLELFWKSWATDLTEAKEFFSDRTSNDKHFLGLFNDDAYFGTVAYDEDKIVAYSIGLHYSKEYCLSGFNKALRGYTNLGLQISYEKAKQAAELGYKQMNLAWINNDFKKQFLAVAETIKTYDFELWRDVSFETKTPHGYTTMMMRP